MTSNTPSISDEVSVEFAGFSVAGWTSVRITRGIERCPSDFEIELTEVYPGLLNTLTVIPGQSCVVKIGDDVVVTGYVDKYIPAIDKGSHSILIQGRGKCQDLVDCSAEWPGSQIPANSAFQIATKLAAPYDIAVLQTSGLDSSLLTATTTFNLILGETAWEIIERVCRNAGVLCYEDNLGNLMLAHGGIATAAGGLAQGVNVESASYTLSADQRYSTYTAFRLSFDSFQELQGGLVLHTVPDTPLPMAPIPPGVTRNRKLFIVAEGGASVSEAICVRKAIWERNRRDGRSQMLHVVTDGWRDANGVLYAPNSLIPVNLPSLKVNSETWLIGEVTYRLNEHGKTAELVLMPPNAFQPEPEPVGDGGFALGPATVQPAPAHHK